MKQSLLLLSLTLVPQATALAQGAINLPGGEKINVESGLELQNNALLDDLQQQKLYIVRGGAVEEATVPVLSFASESTDVSCGEAICGKLVIRPFKVAGRTTIPQLALSNMQLHLMDMESSNFKVTCMELDEQSSVTLIRGRISDLNCQVLYKKKPDLSWNLIPEVKTLLDDEIRSGKILNAHLNAELDTFPIKRKPDRPLELRFTYSQVGEASAPLSLLDTYHKLQDQARTRGLRQLENASQWAMLLPESARETFLEPCRSASTSGAPLALATFCVRVQQARKDNSFASSGLERKYSELRRHLVQGFWAQSLNQDSTCDSNTSVGLNSNLAELQVEIDEGVYATIPGERYVAELSRKSSSLILNKNVF